MVVLCSSHSIQGLQSFPDSSTGVPDLIPIFGCEYPHLFQSAAGKSLSEDSYTRFLSGCPELEQASQEAGGAVVCRTVIARGGVDQKQR